jgi:hypothetical protein
VSCARAPGLCCTLPLPDTTLEESLHRLGATSVCDTSGATVASWPFSWRRNPLPSRPIMPPWWSCWSEGRECGVGCLTEHYVAEVRANTSHQFRIYQSDSGWCATASPLLHPNGERTGWPRHHRKCACSKRDLPYWDGIVVL